MVPTASSDISSLVPIVSRAFSSVASLSFCQFLHFYLILVSHCAFFLSQPPRSPSHEPLSPYCNSNCQFPPTKSSSSSSRAARTIERIRNRSRSCSPSRNQTHYVQRTGRGKQHQHVVKVSPPPKPASAIPFLPFSLLDGDEDCGSDDARKRIRNERGATETDHDLPISERTAREERAHWQYRNWGSFSPTTSAVHHPPSSIPSALVDSELGSEMGRQLKLARLSELIKTQISKQRTKTFGPPRKSDFDTHKQMSMKPVSDFSVKQHSIKKQQATAAPTLKNAQEDEDITAKEFGQSNDDILQEEIQQHRDHEDDALPQDGPAEGNRIYTSSALIDATEEMNLIIQQQQEERLCEQDGIIIIMI